MQVQHVCSCIQCLHNIVHAYVMCIKFEWCTAVLCTSVDLARLPPGSDGPGGSYGILQLKNPSSCTDLLSPWTRDSAMSDRPLSATDATAAHMPACAYLPGAPRSPSLPPPHHSAACGTWRRHSITGWSARQLTLPVHCHDVACSVRAGGWPAQTAN